MVVPAVQSKDEMMVSSKFLASCDLPECFLDELMMDFLKLFIWEWFYWLKWKFWAVILALISFL